MIASECLGPEVIDKLAGLSDAAMIEPVLEDYPELLDPAVVFRITEVAREKIRQALERLGTDGIIIFTDMFGGTPSNISLSFLERDRVEVVTGVNLPMIVKFATMQREARDVTLLAHVITEKGSKAIKVASDLLSVTTQ